MESYGDVEVKVLATPNFSNLSDLGPMEACIPV